MSLSYQPNGTEFEIYYGSDGSVDVAGFVSEDTLAIGGLEIKRQDFAEATRGSDMGFVRFDGILGMDYDVAAVKRRVSTFYQMIAQESVG